MRNTHTTAEGDTMFISQMGNEHLENTIKMHLRNIKECMGIINDTNTTNNVDLLIAGVDSNNIKERAKQRLVQTHEQIGRYLIETQIRGINMSEDFQEAFGRDSASETIDVYKFEVKNKPFDGRECGT